MGRLIDADEYEKRIKPYDTEDVMDKALYNFAHTKLLSTPTAEVTEEAVKEYCRKRCLCIVDSVLLKKYASAQPPARPKGKWLWADGVRCSRCNYKLQSTGLSSYCPNCGADMRETE